VTARVFVERGQDVTLLPGIKVAPLRRVGMPVPRSIQLRLSSAAILAAFAASAVIGAQQASTPPQGAAQQFGGAYSGLDARKQRLVDDWVARFSEVTGQKIEPPAFYDSFIKMSVRTTFDAVTNALLLSKLTTDSGQPLGDALSLIERLETVKGQDSGQPGDRQFRMYVRLTENAVDTLTRSREFKRVGDNTVYHKGYPLNFREQGGAPSIQFSVALDKRRADVDVDYRSSSFPAGLFDGHLTSSNSDVRAGDNYERHLNRWTGLQNWWRSFFGVGLQSPPDEPARATAMQFMKTPRAGNKEIQEMVRDFLTAWLIDGDQVAALSYVSEHAYTCLAQDKGDPSSLDRGMAPFMLLNRLKAAHDALGPRTSLEGLTVGVRVSVPALRVVNQPYHAQFVLSEAPDDIAAKFDCERQQTPATSKPVPHAYGRYYASTFYISMPGGKDHTVVLLWAKEDGYWKIASWQADMVPDDLPPLVSPPEVTLVHVKGDAGQIRAVRDFLQSWLIRKDYGRAFSYVAPAAYSCYDFARSPSAPPSTSPEDAGQKIRAGLERIGTEAGTHGRLDQIIAAQPPTHAAARIVDHSDSGVYTITSVPDAFAAAADCAVRAQGTTPKIDPPSEYGRAYVLLFHFRTQSGETPVLRTLWMNVSGSWRIVAYDVVVP
jgi:hypothetical protein